MSAPTIPHVASVAVNPTDNVTPDDRITVNNPKFVAVPANPSIPVVAPAVNVPLPQFTGFVRIGKSADIDNDHEDNDIEAVSDKIETQSV